MKSLNLSLCLLGMTFILAPAISNANGNGGENKPYTVTADGKIDWYTYNGYRRYHSICHTCHGPAGLGGSFAPNLLTSVKNLSYEKFLEVIIVGRVNADGPTGQSVMPSFGTNPNVMCFVDDVYAYLMARADGVVSPDRPERVDKPEAAKERDNACFGR